MEAMNYLKIEMDDDSSTTKIEVKRELKDESDEEQQEGSIYEDGKIEMDDDSSTTKIEVKRELKDESDEEQQEGSIFEDGDCNIMEEWQDGLEVYVKKEPEDNEELLTEELNSCIEDENNISGEHCKNISSTEYPILGENYEKTCDNGLNLSLNKIFDLYFGHCLEPNPFLNKKGLGNGHFECSNCSYEAETLDELRTHILTHDINSLANINCPSQKIKSSSLNINRTSLTLGELKSEIDGMVGTSSAKRNSNAKSRRHGDKTYACSECDFKTSYRSNLRKHLLIHSDTKKFRCPDCSYETNFKDSLKKHSLTHSDIKLFKCGECDYETSIKGHLKRHSLTHSTIKRFKCDECDYATNHKVHLKTHTLNHKGTLYKCPQCNYGTNVKGSLKRHFLTHNETKLYRCQECEYQTNRQTYLRAHILTHSGMKLFKCHLCPYETNQKVHLNAHVLKHSGLKVFKCMNCPYETNYKHGLKRHLKSHHKELVQSD